MSTTNKDNAFDSFVEKTYKPFLGTLTEEEVDELEDDILKSLGDMRANARGREIEKLQEMDGGGEERGVIDDDDYGEINS